MANRNSWMRKALLKLGERTARSPITKIGERIGAPIRKTIESFSAKKSESDSEKRSTRREKMEKAKRSYKDKYGKPYDWRTANPQETKKLEDLYK